MMSWGVGLVIGNSLKCVLDMVRGFTEGEGNIGGFSWENEILKNCIEI